MKFNIENKESIKMRPHAELFSPCAQGAVVCLATVFMAFSWGASADDGAAPAAAPAESSVTSDVQSYEAEFSIDEKAILGLLAESGALTENNEFEAALQKLGEAKARIEKFEAEKPGKTAEVLKEKYEIFAKDCRRSYAENMLQECRNEYVNVISDKDIAAAAEKGQSMQKQISRAKFMYYLGTYGGEQQALDRAVAQDSRSDFAARADALNADFAKITSYYDVAKETSLDVIDPGYQDRQKDIKKLYHEGEILYRNRRFTQARDKMEQILILDPYNDRATQMLTRIYRKLYLVADMRAYNEMLHDQALIEWRWMENIPREQSVLPDQEAREYTETSSPLYEKSRKLIVPSIEFIDRGVTDAIDYLREKSKEIDPERTGVQIMVTGQSRGKNVDKKVTFSLQNVPLYDAIRYLCLQADLKFRINEKSQIIVIGPEAEIAKGDTKDKIYIPIRRATVNRMVNYSARSEAAGDESSSSSSSSGDGFNVKDGMSGMSVSDTFSTGIAGAMSKRRAAPDYSEKLRKYFMELGFQFPDDTFFIAYDSRKNRIVVQHTPENLRKLELLIREIDIDTPLVLIESKIMEIGMNDYEELGFDWTLTHENVNPRWSFTIASPMRKSQGTNNTLINNMNILPNFGSDNVWSLFLTVNAIDRTDRAEILSSPKLMAKNGESATIRMVRQMYFPDSWSEPEITTSCGSSVSLKPSVPEFGDATDVGVVFTATPTVSPNNYTINLELTPSVVDLVGWSDYSYEIVFGNFGGTTDPSSGTATASTDTSTSNSSKITMKMPELARREVQTKVKVYDGQTVMIGGMLVDRQTRQDDKWPILGEVPLLGRLFSADSTTIEKENMLISVTSRLVSGDGVPLRSNPATGLPDFRR